MTLNSDPSSESDRIMLLVANRDRDLYSVVWEAQHWGVKTPIKNDATNGNMMTQSFTFLWDQDDGDAIIIAPTTSPAPSSSPYPTSMPSKSSQPSSSLQPGGTSIWAALDVPNARYSNFDGVNFGPVITGPVIDDILAVTNKEWKYVSGATAPGRDEKIVVGVTDGDDITAIMWNGTNWGPITFNGTNVLSSTNNDVDWNNAIVAYESFSGDAVLIWNDGSTTKKPRYRVWNGATWTGPFDFLSYPGVEPYWFDIASNPQNDEIVLAIVDSAKALYTAYWNGTSWSGGWGATVTLKNHAGVGIAYKSLSNSAVLVYGKDSAGIVSYKTQTAGTNTWGTESSISFSPASFSSKALRVMLRSDPNSNRLVLGFIDEANDAWVGIWNGTNWQNVKLAYNDLTVTGSKTCTSLSKANPARHLQFMVTMQGQAW